MRIAVTGAAGYIGGHLCAELLARGHEVHATDKRDGEHPGPGTWCTFRLEEDDDFRLRWLQSVKPDVVVHCAARYGRVWCEEDLARTACMNAGVTAALARDCAAIGARMVYVSSSEVYGQSTDGLLPALAPSLLTPRNMYGLTKKWGEEAARLYAPDGLAVARLNMPYGPPATEPGPGEVKTSDAVGPSGYNMLHTFLWQASHGMPITVHRGAERCMTWIGDAVRGLAMITESGEGIYNVCRDDDHRYVGDIAALARKVAGSGSAIEFTDLPPGITQVKRLDASALAALGWKPEVDLEEGMSRSMLHYSRFDREGRWQ